MVAYRFSGNRVLNSVVLALLFLVLISPGLVHAREGQEGQNIYLVIDHRAGTDGRGALFSVDPVTGERRILSDFGDSSQGDLGFFPVSVTVDRNGRIFVADRLAGGGSRGVLFGVDPVTGERTLVSDFGDAGDDADNPEPLGRSTNNIAVEADGNILVLSARSGTEDKGELFSVDPVTGERAILSDFGDAGQGELGNLPRGVAVEADGNILVVNRGNRVLFRFDPETGERTLVSDFGDAGDDADNPEPLGINPIRVAVEADGNILVVDFTGTGGNGALFSVDPETGERTILSDFGDAGDDADNPEPLGGRPVGVVVEADGNILVVDTDAGTGENGALFRVNPDTGQRTLVSDFGDSSQGDLGIEPFDIVDIAVVPSDECTEGTHNCDENATCVDRPLGFTCECNEGFSGDGVTCTDIDECDPSPCSNGGTCTDTGVNSFSCDCTDTGYTGETCGDDVNECAENNGGCDQNATCTNTPGSFTCECNEEFMGDGIECEMIVIPPEAEVCNDSIDNDGDGNTDCDDMDCENDPSCVISPPPPPPGDDDDDDTPTAEQDDGESGCNIIAGKSPTTMDFAGALLPFMFIPLAVFYRRRIMG